MLIGKAKIETEGEGRVVYLPSIVKEIAWKEEELTLPNNAESFLVY